MGDETPVPSAPAASPADAAPDSALAALRAQRSKAQAQAKEFHIKIPRMELYGAYRPVEPGALEEAVERRRKQAKTESAKQDITVHASADVLVAHCMGLYRLDEDGNEVGLDPAQPTTWSGYDRHLGEALGYDAPTPVAACLGLFVTHADLVTHASRLTTLSGFDAGEAEERFRGE